MAKNHIIRDLMTPGPEVISPQTSVSEAARLMKEGDFGSLIVADGDGSICGIVTDRDIVLRCVATKKDPSETIVDEIYSKDPVCLSPEDSVDDAVKTMASQSIRRIPVVQDGHAVGIVSLGDLAVERDPRSALGSISAAPAQA